MIDMKVDNVYYARSMPTKLIVEIGGRIYAANKTPYRKVQASELTELPIRRPYCGEVLGEEVPAYWWRFYGFERSGD